MIDAERAARRCGAGPPATSPGPSAPTGACSRSARRRATSACSTCARGVSGASRVATRASVDAMRFTPDGRTLVTSGADGELIVWDVARGEIRETLSGHAKGEVYGLARLARRAHRCTAPATTSARSRGTSPATGASCGRSPSRGRSSPTTATTLPRGLALSPDGRTLAVGHSDGTVDFLDARTLRRRRSLRALRGFVGAIAYSPDGRLLAVAGQRGQVTLWDARTLRPAGELRGLRTVSPDARVLTRRRAARRRRAGHRVDAGDASSIDGRQRAGVGRATARADGACASRRRRPRSPSVPTAASSRPRRSRTPRRSATRAAAGSSRGSAPPTGGDRWRSRPTARCSRPATTTAPASSGRPRAGSRSDGRSRATTASASSGWSSPPTARCWPRAGQDGAVALWDVETQNPIGPPLTVEPDSYVAADLSPDGSRLFAVSAHPASRPLGRRSRGLEAARLPRRGARAHTAGVGRRAARPALPNRLPARLTAASGSSRLQARASR